MSVIPAPLASEASKRDQAGTHAPIGGQYACVCNRIQVQTAMWLGPGLVPLLP